jgi:hypothetical protein
MIKKWGGGGGIRPKTGGGFEKFLSLYISVCKPEGNVAINCIVIEDSYDLFHQICLLCSLFYFSSCLNVLLFLRIKIFL